MIQQFDGLGNDLQSFSQTIDGFANGMYQVSFDAAGREGYGRNPFVVDIDGVQLTFAGSSIVSPAELSSTQGYAHFMSDSLSLTAGSHTLSFTSSAPWAGGDTSFIDAVTVSSGSPLSSVPEPSSIVFLGAGAFVLLGRYWCRRRNQIPFNAI
ncbi:MAG: PEP-CTERM sorting domain-containing protein [Planctomycetota bacterium]|nr:PEP-CTERM sorting domain-containing protein [Planctomycetota bacterium]